MTYIRVAVSNRVAVRPTTAHSDIRSSYYANEEARMNASCGIEAGRCGYTYMQVDVLAGDVRAVAKQATYNNKNQRGNKETKAAVSVQTSSIPHQVRVVYPDGFPHHMNGRQSCPPLLVRACSSHHKPFPFYPSTSSTLTAHLQHTPFHVRRC